MSARRSELTREAARLFAERGYHGTSIGDLGTGARRAERLALCAHLFQASDLLYETMREGANAFHGALDSVPDEGPPSSGSAWRCVRICASSPSSSTSRPSSSASGATWKASGEKRSWPSGGATGPFPCALSRRAGARGVPHGSRRRCCGTAGALGNELGVHLALPRPRHRRPGRSLLRHAARRRARLRHARLMEFQGVATW